MEQFVERGRESIRATGEELDPVVFALRAVVVSSARRDRACSELAVQQARRLPQSPSYSRHERRAPNECFARHGVGLALAEALAGMPLQAMTTMIY